MSYMEIFAKEYLGRVFYFCLKKTGNEQDAAELSAEIGLEVVKALSKGREPEKFDTWLWAVVHNRWAGWAAKKYYRTPEQVDIQEYEEVLASDTCLEEDFVRSQELEQVRRELAFIRADYREILVAHYFEGKSVSEISRRFGLPLGTVKTRLQNSRKILKEGMNMARQFGTRSFQPETIIFRASGKQTSGLPWSAINRKIPVNILCAAHNNPSTLEELSMELGIAMPYMEEEVGLLEKSELLKKQGNRYVTSFFISPRECKNEVNELACGFAERLYGEIWELAGKALEKGREYNILNGTVSEIDARAFFAFWIEHQLQKDVLPEGIFRKFTRNDGGSWGFMGIESGEVSRLPRSFFSNSNSQSATVQWKGYQCVDAGYGKNPYGRIVPNWDWLEILRGIASGREISTFSDAEMQILEYLLDEGFCVLAEDGSVRVAALIFRNNTENQIKNFFSALPEYSRMTEEMYRYKEAVKEIIARYSVSCLKEDFDYYVAMSMEQRSVFARLWRDKGLYCGGSAQFAAFCFCA